MAAMASRLLTDKGQSVTFSRLTGATFDPVLGNDSGGSITTFTGYGAATDYNKLEIDGTVVKRGDIKLILESTTTEPEQGDKCTVDSVDYRVMGIEPITPAGTLVISKVQLRV
jgi:hypothetical protein